MATGTPRACSNSDPPPGWGTVAQIRDPHLAAQAFYGVAAHTHNPGLVDITGWQSMSVAAAAQAVQISAFPSAYAKWEATAKAVVRAAQQPGASTGSRRIAVARTSRLGWGSARRPARRRRRA